MTSHSFWSMSRARLSAPGPSSTVISVLVFCTGPSRSLCSTATTKCCYSNVARKKCFGPHSGQTVAVATPDTGSRNRKRFIAESGKNWASQSPGSRGTSISNIVPLTRILAANGSDARYSAHSAMTRLNGIEAKSMQSDGSRSTSCLTC